MDNTMPILLVPGLVSSPRIYAPVIPALWRFGPVTVANHIRDDNMGAIARRMLAEAPPRFALAGHSMGGYIAFEIMRQAPERVAKLALINTQARPDTPEATARRRGLMARAASGELSRRAATRCFPAWCIRRAATMPHCASSSTTWATMSASKAFIRQQTAIIGRPDSRPTLACDQMPDAGADRRPGQHHPECALDGDGRAAFPARNSWCCRIAVTCRSRNSRRRRRDALVEWLRNSSCFGGRERPRSGA